MRSIRLDSRARRGATIAIVAVSLAALLAVGALAVDTGMLLKVRADAQRGADAAALAGASAFLVTDPLSAPPIARDRALEYAGRNYMGGRNIDVGGVQWAGANGVWTAESNEAKVEIASNIRRVRVTIHRATTGAIFGSMLGFDSLAISAFAAAELIDAGGARCVMPFGIPDVWDEPTQDANGNRVQDGTEKWSFDPASGDRYSPFNPDVVDATQTGYGSDWRNGNGQGITDDLGRSVLLKPQSPKDANGPSNFNLWKFNGDPNSASDIYDRITECDPRNVVLGDSVTHVVAPGNKVGQVQTGVQELINRDAGASWNSTTNKVQGSKEADWRNSARVVRVALYSPDQINDLKNNDPLVFNNIALFFLEFASGNGPQVNVGGRFLYYASGGPGGGTTGPLVKRIRLVE